MKPSLSIIIVNWNVRDQLEANLARLASLKEEVAFEVFVVDNASADGSVEMIHTRFPWVHLIANDWNAGFAYACNQALAYARGEVLLLLNPDTLVSAGSLAHTCKVLKSDTSIGVLGVRLEREGAVVESVRRDPGVLDQLAILLKLPHLWKGIQSVNHYLAKDMDYGKTARVEQVRGAFFAFRKDVHDVVGSFDERFFLWFEEVDYCKRVREAGYSVVYDASVTVEDYVGQSFAQVSRVRKQRVFTASMAKYVQKHIGFVASLPFWALRPFVIAAAGIEQLVKGRS